MVDQFVISSLKEKDLATDSSITQSIRFRSPVLFGYDRA